MLEAYWAIFSSELYGGWSPVNWAKKIAGPWIVFIALRLHFWLDFSISHKPLIGA